MATYSKDECLHRLVKEVLDSGAAANLAEADQMFRGFRLGLHMEASEAADSGCQTALLTAVALAKRVFLGGAVDVTLDTTARLLIPPELRAYAGLARDVMLVGMGRHFEIWDAARFAAKEAETLKQELPEALKSFSF